MSQNIGGHSPTNSARRSALPRSSWSTVLARIHSPMHRPIAPSPPAWRCQPRRPASWSALVSMRADLPAGAAAHAFDPGRAGTRAPMPRRPSLARRLTTAARWPLGIALTSWSYMWRTTPMHRREEDGAPGEDNALPLPDAVDRDEIQGADDGVGPLFHRRYA